jgi:hypothetical protein
VALSTPLHTFGSLKLTRSLLRIHKTKRIYLFFLFFLFSFFFEYFVLFSGGGDMGRLWYEDGKLLSKKNTFLDFIASAKHLAQEKYSSKERIAITGASAGGLLMGAVTTMAGLDICKAVVAEVPFVDCINTMLDPTLPLTVVEYEEWGTNRSIAHRPPGLTLHLYCR